MISNYRMLVGPRGEPVCLSFDALKVDSPILTVELASKWYGLCLVRPSAHGDVVPTVEELDFGVFDEIQKAPFGPSVCDHVPNPVFVERLAQEKGWEIDDLGWELIVGRWHAEIVGLRGPRQEGQPGRPGQPGGEEGKRDRFLPACQASLSPSSSGLPSAGPPGCPGCPGCPSGSDGSPP